MHIILVFQVFTYSLFGAQHLGLNLFIMSMIDMLSTIFTDLFCFRFVSHWKIFNFVFEYLILQALVV